MRPRAIWIVSPIVFAGCIAIAKFLYTPTVCETTTLAALRSPDQEYEAISVLHVCPAGFTDAFADVVRLVRISTSQPPVDVVVVSEPYRDEDDPVLSWSDNKTLVVEVGDRSHIYRHVVIENSARVELRRRSPVTDHPK